MTRNLSKVAGDPQGNVTPKKLAVLLKAGGVIYQTSSGVWLSQHGYGAAAGSLSKTGIKAAEKMIANGELVKTVIQIMGMNEAGTDFAIVKREAWKLPKN